MFKPVLFRHNYIITKTGNEMYHLLFFFPKKKGKGWEEGIKISSTLHTFPFNR